MHHIEIIIILLAIIAGLAEIADKVKIPYPILLVISGIGVGFIPGLPKVVLDPDLIFLIFLPPLLYSAAWATSWPDFKAARRPISLLALGCVLFSTTGVAIVAHYIIPGFSWEAAFLLGAIISPPDAVAATSITKSLGVPRRVVTVLEGESLVNDATGLIAYRYAVAAVVTGNFVLWQAGLEFLYVAAAGVIVGLIVGYVIKFIHKITPDNPTIDTSLTILTPFITYLIAERLHVSGVLAVVTTGLFLNRLSSEIFSHQTRIQAISVWNTLVFLINGIVFILIGLQLPSILDGIQGASFIELIFYGAIISLAVIVTRIIWVFPGTYLPRWLSRNIREKEPKPPIKLVSIVAWTGMRGVVSLAAALALPLTINENTPFPHRNLILFLTFCVILSTLVFQGLSLPFLIKLLNIKLDGSEEKEEKEVRLKVALTAVEYIESDLSLGISDDVLNRLKTKYEVRIGRLMVNIQQENHYNEALINQFNNLQEKVLQMERNLIIEWRKEGKISDEVLRKLEYELDLEESRLALEKGL